jgi:bacteriophage N4 adsorption protein A
MKLFSTLLALALAVPAIGSAQTIDAPDDLTGYARFIVYPHLQQGWESMQRGDRDGALAEFERARSLAPTSATVALHLATAYQRFGELRLAESVLSAQIRLTPGDPRLPAALTAVRAMLVPPATPAAASGCMDDVGTRCNDVPPSSDRRATTASPMVSFTHTIPAKPAAPRRAKAQHTDSVPPPAPVERPGDGPQFAADFMLALQGHDFDEAARQADTWLAHDASGAAVLDVVTYQLLATGATEQAMNLLLHAYPFANRAPAERDTLLQRLIMLIEQQPGVLPAERLWPLRQPLDTPSLRSRQAVLWERLNDCGAVRSVLGDGSPEFGYDDWLRLGDCSSEENPDLAERAYMMAHTLQAGGRASRALGYQAYSTGHFDIALNAWRSVEPQKLTGDELLAAVSTAVAADAIDQAANWLDTYHGRGDTLNHRYWSLLADTTLRSDPSTAADALRHAIDLAPEADDYRRLASLEPSSALRVDWLQRAATLDPDDSGIQAQLGYAYSDGGWTVSAVRAFERAAALAPDDRDVQCALGFAYWRAGFFNDAQRTLESAWRADPTNQQIAQQLVYVHQRLKHNREAREYAEHVLDAYAASDTSTGDSQAVADQRFVFQRTHEDLGRRVTVNADGWSGTSVGTGTSGSQAGSRYQSFAQVEADVRLGNPPIRDGSTVSAYVRVLTDGGELFTALPSQNALLGVGLRWKPWRNQAAYFAVENQNGLADRTRRDVLLRASTSLFNGGRASDDWHASGNGWFSRNLYIDVAHYIEAKHSAVTADYRTSYHRKLSTGQTFEPYGHLQINGAKDVAFQRDLRVGVGVRWNIWYGSTQYDAAPHKISLGLEFQQALQTYLPDHNGVFLALGTRW